MTTIPSIQKTLVGLGILGLSQNAPAGHSYRAELRTEPEKAKAGEVTSLILTIRDSAGNATSAMEILHEKPVRLIVVSSDLSEFAHLHPEQKTTGIFETEHLFPAGGEYLLFADFAPRGGVTQVEQFSRQVTGTTTPRVPLVESGTTSVEIRGVEVAIVGKKLTAGANTELTFLVVDPVSKKPVTDLQPYLGEAGHFVIISEDGKEFLHAHPVGQSPESHHNHGHDHHGNKKASKLPGKVTTVVAFPSPGRYKIWAQFQRNDEVIVAPFVVRVEASTGMHH